VKYYGNSAVSYVKRYGVVNTVRRAVDTINTKLRSAGQKTYTTVNNFLKNQYNKISSFIKNNPYLPGDLLNAGGWLSGLDLGLLLGAGKTFLGYAAIPLILYEEGNILLDFRDHNRPVEEWKYISIHRSWAHGYKLEKWMGSDGYMYYMEIPKNPDGSLNYSGAVTYGGGDPTYEAILNYLGIYANQTDYNAINDKIWTFDPYDRL